MSDERITVKYTEEPEYEDRNQYEDADDDGNQMLEEDDDEISQELNFEDDDENLPPFQFFVSDPSKVHKGKNLSFWFYKISTRTTLTSFKQRTNVVRRRYSHFLWLRNQLLEDYPGCIIPPLPEKSILGAVEKYVSALDTKRLLEYRQRSLLKFLTRVGEHTELQQSPHLQAFIEMKFNDFNEYTKSIDKERKKTGGLTWFKKSLTPEPKWITQQKKFVAKLEEALRFLKLKLQDMVKKRREMSKAIGDFGRAFNNLGLVEKAYEDGSLSTSLVELSNKSEQISVNILSLAERETMQIVETITYYLGMCDAMKKLMKRLEVFRLERDDLTNTLRNTQAVLVKVQKLNNEQKIKATEEKIATIQDKLRSAEEILQNSEVCFKNDIERFDMERKVDFAYMLHAFVALQIDHSENMRLSWESLLPSVQSLQEV